MTGPTINRLSAVVFAFMSFLLTGTAGAESITLEAPVTCLGKNCWLSHYYDVDPDKERSRDYACGDTAGNGHTGTDFALRDQASMHEGDGGVVVAAAGGKVIRLRDGMDDVSVRVMGTDKVAGKECGNGIAIDHGDGWETEYCHLRKGSVAAKKGDTVKTGDKLGTIGLSGSTEHLHMHFEVRKNGKSVDPFVGPTPPAIDAACGLGAETLWSKAALAAMPYKPLIVYNLGFSAVPPTLIDVRSGSLHAQTFPNTAETMFTWAEIIGLVKGDSILFRVTFPDGKKREAKAALTTVPPEYLPTLKTARPGARWPSGHYVFEVAAIRPGKNGGVYTAREDISVP